MEINIKHRISIFWQLCKLIELMGKLIETYFKVQFPKDLESSKLIYPNLQFAIGHFLSYCNESVLWSQSGISNPTSQEHLEETDDGKDSDIYWPILF